jgi:hypothetical protein
MKDDGYTLAEMLIAFVMIGLAVGGLTQGTRLIGLMQASAATAVQQARSLRLAHEGMDRLLQGQGPFSTRDRSAGAFNGSSTGFSFDCAKISRCGASLRTDDHGALLSISGPTGQATTMALPGIISARFLYGGDSLVGPVWPLATDKPQSLKWITLVRDRAGDPTPVMSVRLWVDEVPTCQFDTITRDCRNVGG